MIDKTIQIEDLIALRSGFKEFLNINYSQLTHKDIICSEAFHIFRKDLGINPREVLSNEDGVEIYRMKLMQYFLDRGRKKVLNQMRIHIAVL